MQNFKQFINEETSKQQYQIDVDSRVLENNKDAINADFDRLTANRYQNSMVFFNQVRGTLERYGMIVPPSATKHFLKFETELSFKLGDSDLFLYVVFNTIKNAYVEGYAQVVDMSELMQLMSSNEDVPHMEDDEEDEGEEEEEEDEDEEGMKTSERSRKSDSEAGDTGEY